MSSRLSILIAAIAAITSVQAAHAAPDPDKCKLENLNTGVKYSPNLQDALDAATAGDVLLIKGTCVGNFTINKNITLQGKATKKAPVPTLDGNNTGSVITSTGTTLDLIDLVITNGVASCTSDEFCLVAGGGIRSENGGRVNLHGTTSVTGNTVSCTSTGTSFLSGCRAQGGGIYVGAFGFGAQSYVTLNDLSSVTGNTVSCSTTGAGAGIEGCVAEGGGIYNTNFQPNVPGRVAEAIVTLNHQSSVTGNTAAATVGGAPCIPSGYGFPGDPCQLGGGGIFNKAFNGGFARDARVILNDSSVVSGNTPDQILNL